MIMGGYTEVLNTSMIDHVKPKNEISSLKAHGLLSIIMMLLLLLHIAGIIKHYLKTNENVLKRILPK
jgi:cytochrome b561